MVIKLLWLVVLKICFEKLATMSIAIMLCMKEKNCFSIHTKGEMI